MVGAEGSGSGSAASEPLSCVSCRARKLKCDRVRPVCTRCAKVKGDCVYPESRRKPACRRRNVKELEARLAQVEDMLSDAKTADKLTAGQTVADGIGAELDDFDGSAWVGDFDFNEAVINGLANGTVPFSNPPISQDPAPLDMPDIDLASDGSPGGQLMGLGQLESLPPFEVIEALQTIFFENMHHFIPLIHPGKYLQAFHSAPHLRPPMCLQYAIWTTASNCNAKYACYHDVFYQRARRYLEVDEMEGYGERFITVAHAQAWALVATDEARCMLFTRSGMSGARCIRLCEMMALQRLDDRQPSGAIPDVLAPPQNWVELEERRRTFWAAFCIDSHASISTGWPNLIESSTITTRLPSSEESFIQGRDDESCPTLSEALDGSPYSTFASAVLTCHIFNQLSRHIHRPMPSDRAEDVDFGPFWARHRDLDNTLSSAFMFLPERFQLPRHLNNPVAVHTNMNMHASVIALHTCALEKLEKHDLSASMRRASQDRMLTSAREVVNIMKLTSHMNYGYRSPLVALALYCAGSVFIYNARDSSTPEPTHIANLEFLVKCMEAIGREHIITRAFLQQMVTDIDNNAVPVAMQLPFRDKTDLAPVGNCIPLLARSALLRYSDMATPLPGRLPLAKPVGTAFPRNPWHPAAARLCDTGEVVRINYPTLSSPSGLTNKRRRVVSPGPSSSSSGLATSEDAYQNIALWAPVESVDDGAEQDEQQPEQPIAAASPARYPGLSPIPGSGASFSAGLRAHAHRKLPHRSQPSSSASPRSGGQTHSNNTPPPTTTQGSGNTPETSVSATSVDEVYSTAMVFARAVETGVLGGLNDIAGFGDFEEHLNSWDMSDTENLYLQVQSALRNDQTGDPTGTGGPGHGQHEEG